VWKVALNSRLAGTGCLVGQAPIPLFGSGGGDRSMHLGASEANSIHTYTLDSATEGWDGLRANWARCEPDDTSPYLHRLHIR